MDGTVKKVSFAQAVRLNLRAWGIWRRLCPGLFVSITGSSVIEALSPYVSIWLIGRIINELAGEGSLETVVKLAAAQLLAAAFLGLMGGALKRFKNCETDAAVSLYSRIFMDKMFSLDFSYMDSQETYDLYSQIVQNDKWSGLGLYQTTVLFERFMTAAVRILGGIFLTVSMFLARVPEEESGFAWMNHPLWGVFMAVLMLFISGVSSACAHRGQAYWTRYAAETRFGNRLADYYVSLNKDKKRAVDLRMYNQQENVCSVYMKRYNPFGPSSKIVGYAREPMGFWMAVSQSITVVLTAAVYFLVYVKAWAGAYGPGAVTQYIGALGNLFSGICDMMSALGRMASNGNFLETTYEFLDLPGTMYQGSLTTEKRGDRQYEIEFRDVSFRYPGTEQYALRHVNMKFPVGSRLAVVGMNGSGKTTFIKLLCRLYDPEEGEILLNGIDIRKYRYEDYRRLFSVVFQDFQLFALPLGENVAGSGQYSSKRAARCLMEAGFYNCETVMSQGLDTCLYKELKEEGVEVSGGEAQKIAIARALYRDAPFMILDEPTAALDPVAEAEIYERLHEIAGDRTAVYISHRLSSCKFCDRIAVFHEGTVVQQGSHEELLADMEGMYYRLWRVQAGYYC